MFWGNKSASGYDPQDIPASVGAPPRTFPHVRKYSGQRKCSASVCMSMRISESTFDAVGTSEASSKSRISRLWLRVHSRKKLPTDP